MGGFSKAGISDRVSGDSLCATAGVGRSRTARRELSKKQDGAVGLWNNVRC